MKNFTKQNFKTNPLWIRLLIMTFMLLIGTGSAWAVNNVSGGYIYFDNSTTKWSDASIQFVIGHNSYSRTYVMNKLANSNVYYYKLDDAQYHTWSDATYYAVIGTSSKWGDGSWGSSNLTNATHRTAAYTSTYNLNSGSTYCFTPSSSSNGASLSITTSYPNTTNRAYVYSVSSGSTASSSNAAAGTVKVAGYYISSQGTTSSRSATSSASTYSASNTFVRGTTITMSVVSTGSGYTFKGWYSSSTASSGNLLGNSTTYTYTSSGSSTKTVYAVFEENPTVVISETGGTGTVTLGSTTLSTSATSMASGTYDLSITAPTGYNVKNVTVTGGSLTTAGTLGSNSYSGKVNVSAATTISVEYEKACDDVTTPTLSIERGIIDKCGDITTGIIEITNYNIYSNCTFTLNGDVVNPTNAGKIANVTASGECIVVVTNSCGNSSDEATIEMPKTTVKAPTAYDVILTYPQVSFATNNGGVNINLSQSERDVTYYLYKNGTKVTGSDKQGDGKALTWSVIESGTYTVKAANPCDGGVKDMTGSVDFTCMSNLELAFEGDKSVFCPGETANIIVTFNGTGKGNDETNYGKYGWQWEKTNIDYTSVYLSESGVKVPVTIKGDGSISLSVRSCDGTVNSNTLEFTVNPAPQTPVVAISPNPVGQSKVTTLSIASYSADNNYIVYRSDDNAVGNDTEVGAYTAPMNISHNDTGSYYYYAKATNKSCANLTATSAIVKLDVQEAGATIAALGDLKVDPQDPVDFVAMYVKNDGLSDFTDQGATKVKGYTWEYSSDSGNSWTPCVSTATIGVTNGSDKCNNFRPSAVGKYRCKVTYDVGEQTSNVLTVTGDGNTAKTFKGVTMNIPVISVNTGKGNFPTCDGLSGTASKNADVIKEKISVDVKIFNTDGTVYYDRKARMNYRGSSSLNFVKKSYAFCTGKEKTKNDKGAVDTGKENLFGLSNGAKDKDWVLYAAAADPSIMRNRLMFDTFRDMTGGWSVNSMYVELVINGEYKGVYVLMDKITANEKRVNVSWNLDKQGNTTQEGFIVKFDKTDIVDRYENTSGDQKTFKSTYSGHDGFTTYDTQIDQRFEIEYPEKEDIEEEDLEKGQQAGDWSVVFNSIKDKFNKFEQELAKGNFSEVQKIIDYQSWADWFIITEFGKNIDGYRASNLFVYDGSKPNAKIEARPLWDQELSFNNQCPNYYASYGANNVDGFMVDKSNNEAYNNDASTPFWFTGRYKGGRGTYNGSDQTFKGLLDDPCFVAVVKSRWETHKADALSKTKLDAKVTAYTNEMGAAKDREANFWSTRSRETCQCSYSGSTGYVNTISFTDSKNAISTWITTRPAGLNTAINALKGLDLSITLTLTPDGGVTTPWEAVMVQVNNPSGYDYDFEYTTNSLDQVEGVIIQESNDKYTYRIPRPENWGYGDDTRTGIEYGIQATLKVDDAGSQCGSDIDDSLTKATATITLVDEENDGCNIK